MRKQPIRRLVLGDVISRSFLPERSLTFSNILHDWKEDKFLYTMIYRLTIISFNYHCYTGIKNKMHRLTKEVDTFIGELLLFELWTMHSLKVHVHSAHYGLPKCEIGKLKFKAYCQQRQTEWQEPQTNHRHFKDWIFRNNNYKKSYCTIIQYIVLLHNYEILLQNYTNSM